MRILVIGTGGHARVACDAARRAGHEIISMISASPGDVVELVAAQYPESDACFVAIGFSPARAAVCDALRSNATKLANIIHPTSYIAEDVMLGDNIVVMAGAVVNVGTTIGNGCVINTRASVDHDCELGDYAVVSPGATLGGNVKLGAFSWIGLGASVVHNTSIGEHSVIGAGAAVTEDVAPKKIAVGVPCRVIRSREEGEQYL